MSDSVTDLEFAKLSGAGNDFIAVDNRDRSLDEILSTDFIRKICTRGISVGADGLLELREDPDHAFAMVYYNSDGRRATMCGNGGRCIVAYAAALGLIEGPQGTDQRERIMFRSDAGVHRAALADDPGEVVLWMTPPAVSFMDRAMSFSDGRDWKVSLVDTGVPHAVISIGGNDIDSLDLETLAPPIRHSGSFAPDGVNVNFVSLADGEIRMRTWERGIEGETLACGTGAVAVAVAFSSLGLVRLPVSIGVASRLRLTVGMSGANPWLQGEARLVYRARLSDFWPA